MFTLEGHVDFIKSLTILPTTPPLLVSTSSDKTFCIWNLAPLSRDASPVCVQVVREHSRPVQCATWRAVLDADDRPTGVLTLWTADSMGFIKQWRLENSKAVFVKDIKVHETSISQLYAVDDGLWSGSMDNTAAYHTFGQSNALVIPHARYVKSILPLPDLPGGRSLVLTGSADEEIRVWDVSAIPDEAPKLLSVVSGHCGEVSTIRSSPALGPILVVTGSLDGTLRRWSLQQLLHPERLQMGTPADQAYSAMTEEEEQELAELVSYEDD